jgi:hypothetical protein
LLGDFLKNVAKSYLPEPAGPTTIHPKPEAILVLLNNVNVHSIKFQGSSVLCANLNAVLQAIKDFSY